MYLLWSSFNFIPKSQGTHKNCRTKFSSPVGTPTDGLTVRPVQKGTNTRMDWASGRHHSRLSDVRCFTPGHRYTRTRTCFTLVTRFVSETHSMFSLEICLHIVLLQLKSASICYPKTTSVCLQDHLRHQLVPVASSLIRFLA